VDEFSPKPAIHFQTAENKMALATTPQSSFNLLQNFFSQPRSEAEFPVP
jgi:hypothetical protein